MDHDVAMRQLDLESERMKMEIGLQDRTQWRLLLALAVVSGLAILAFHLHQEPMAYMILGAALGGAAVRRQMARQNGKVLIDKKSQND
jgi:hypothetical protein